MIILSEPTDSWPTIERDTLVAPPPPPPPLQPQGGPPPDRRIGAGMLLALGAIVLVVLGALIAWVLTHRNGDPNTVAATTVVVTLQDESTHANSSQPFNCALNGGVSGAEFPGTYDFGFTLTGSAGIITTGSAQTGIAIQSMMTAHVNPVVFSIP